jgi:hypothetical protein
VYDSLILQIPNIFTPNNDGLNEVFGIHSNLPVSIAYEIYNRWGNVVAQGTKEWSPLIVGGFYELWDASTSLSTQNSTTNSSQVPDGVYFYKINITSASDLLKPSIQNLFPIEKEGFLQVVR